jgi:dTDP-4-dehydrorhamnose 3,5-epimerase
LTSHGGEQLFVPRGFAHGYCTLKPLTTVEYKCDAYYSPEHEFGINYGDPQIGIQWPIDRDKIIVSERDAALPSMQNVKLSFAR